MASQFTNQQIFEFKRAFNRWNNPNDSMGGMESCFTHNMSPLAGDTMETTPKPIPTVALEEVMFQVGQKKTKRELEDMIDEVTIDFSKFLEMVRNRQLSHKDDDEVKEAFSKFDENNDGTIQTKSLKAAFQSLGHFPNFADLAQMKRWIYISFPDFLTIMARKM